MSPPLATWVDGVATDQVAADDRGLHYGDGLFETLRVRGQPRFLELHLARLMHGCRQLGIDFGKLSALREDIERAARQAPAEAVLKLLVTRGSALRRGYAPDGHETARRIVSLWTASSMPDTSGGVDLIWSTQYLADNSRLAGIKHLSRLENVLAAGEARVAGAFEALLRGADGRLISGAMSNVFVVSRGKLRTPAVNRAGVAGVMRAVVLRESARLGIAVEECRLDEGDLASADEVFISNARLGVVPVRRVGEHAWAMTDTARRLAAHIETLHA